MKVSDNSELFRASNYKHRGRKASNQYHSPRSYYAEKMIGRNSVDQKTPRDFMKGGEEFDHWSTTSMDYGMFQQRIRERLLGERKDQLDKIEVDSVKRPPPSSTPAEKQSAPPSGRPPGKQKSGKVRLPSLDHSKYLIAMPSPKAATNASQAPKGQTKSPTKQPATLPAHEGLAWNFMTNECGRFMANIPHLAGKKAPPEMTSSTSQVLTVDPKLHPPNASALPPKEEYDSKAYTHSIPSSSSSRSSSCSPAPSSPGTGRPL